MLGDPRILIMGAWTMMKRCRSLLIGRHKLVVFPVGLVHRTFPILEKHMEMKGHHLKKGVPNMILTSPSGINVDYNHFTLG